MFLHLMIPVYWQMPMMPRDLMVEEDDPMVKQILKFALIAIDMDTPSI